MAGHGNAPKRLGYLAHFEKRGTKIDTFPNKTKFTEYQEQSHRQSSTIALEEGQIGREAVSDWNCCES